MALKASCGGGTTGAALGGERLRPMFFSRSSAVVGATALGGVPLVRLGDWIDVPRAVVAGTVGLGGEIGLVGAGGEMATLTGDTAGLEHSDRYGRNTRHSKTYLGSNTICSSSSSWSPVSRWLNASRTTSSPSSGEMSDKLSS